MGKNEMHQLPAGTLVSGRYKILERLGQGGFGITYKGYDSVLDVAVAIKEYYPSGIASRYNEQSLDVQVGGSENWKLFEEGKKKFLDEARVLARFSEDPNVVGVRDFFEDNQTVYIVMQYLEGMSLKEYTEKNGRLSFDETFALLAPVMESLDRIHAAGLIHRDISPSNLIRMPGGKVKLIDFGTAREFSTDGEKSLSVVLKPGYAPAEQYLPRGLQGPWTDVYALCASIYRVITGITPENSLNRMTEDRVKLPSECGAVISAAQEKVLMQGLAVQESARIRSMDSLEKQFRTATLIPGPDSAGEGAAFDAVLDSGFDDERTVTSISGEYTFERSDSDSGPEKDRSHPGSGLEEDRSYSDPAPEEDRSYPVPGPEITQGDPGPEGVRSYPSQEDDWSDPGPDLRGKHRAKAAPRKGLRLGIIAAVLCALAAALLYGILSVRSGGSGGGEISNWSGDKKIVRFSSTGEKLTIEKSMLDVIDRNKEVAALSFYNCVLSDDVIGRLASMKQISYVSLSVCSGFSTLTPLSDLEPLRELRIEGRYTSEKEQADGTALFTSDLPQLTAFMMGNCRLKNGFGFLEHFPGLEKLTLSSLEPEGEFGRLPEHPALQSVIINGVDLTGVDLSAFGHEPQLTYLAMSGDQLTDLSFLRTASALSYVSVEENRLTSLEGLQDKEHLSSLSAADNEIEDISALSTCESLRSFFADRNRIKDISPLGACSELSSLQLNDNQISDISALSGCPGLAGLAMRNNEIRDAGPLSTCTKLRTLYLDGNHIAELSCLSGCEEMKDLSFSRNEVSDLKFCEKMLVLETLKASENRIDSLDGLQNVTQLQEVRLDRNRIPDVALLAKSAEHLKTVVLDQNLISDLGPLNGCVSLEGLSVNENQLTNLNALKGCPRLYFLSASGNQISDISGLEGCTALYMADLGENRITDISALSASTVTKMGFLLQNNQIRDISPLYGAKDYLYLSLYNNAVTDITGLYSMSGIESVSTIYLDWSENMDPADLSGIPYRTPRLVDVPLDRQVNMLNTFQETRREAGKNVGSITFLTKEEADEEIAQVRTDARISAGIEQRQEETEETEGTGETAGMEVTEETAGTGETQGQTE